MIVFYWKIILIKASNMKQKKIIIPHNNLDGLNNTEIN